MITPVQLDRFLTKFTLDVNDRCWLWTANPSGRYGKFSVDGVEYGAHVVMWTITHNRWPEPGEFVRHTCDVPRCVNPSHLVIGSPADNVTDMVSRGRHRYNPSFDGPRATCKRGHDLTAPNARLTRPLIGKTKYGGGCRTCRNQLRRERNATRRAAETP